MTASATRAKCYRLPGLVVSLHLANLVVRVASTASASAGNVAEHVIGRVVAHEEGARWGLGDGVGWLLDCRLLALLLVGWLVGDVVGDCLLCCWLFVVQRAAGCRLFGCWIELHHCYITALQIWSKQCKSNAHATQCTCNAMHEPYSFWYINLKSKV